MRGRRAGLAFIFVTVFIDMLGLGIVIPVLPHLIASFVNGDLSIAAEYYGYFIAIFAAMQFLFSPVLGKLSDQHGRRPVLLLSLFGTGLDYMLQTFAPSLPWLFLGRIISGVTAASFTVANAYIADVSVPEERAQNFGVIGAAFGLGFIFGPVLGGLLGGLGPRVPFMAAGVLAFLNWGYGFFVLPESLAPENRRQVEWRTANPLASLADLRRYPVVISLAATVICTNLAGFALQSTWVLYTTLRFQWDSVQQGLSLALFGLTSIVMQGWLLRLVLPRLGERRALVIALIFSFVGYVLYGLATQGWMMYAILAGTALSWFAQPAAQGLISRSVPPNEQGAVQGALTSLVSLTAILGPIVSTDVFSYFTSAGQSMPVPGAAFFLAAALTWMGLMFAVRTFRRAPMPQIARDEY